MDLENGQVYEMQGSGKLPYKIKNVGGVYSCTCPAWCNQSKPSNARTCKHIIKLRGAAVEEARLASAGELLPNKPKESADVKELPLLQGFPWDEKQDLTGWWMSEKLDGVRAYWDGTQFLSRYNNIFHAPDWFKAGFPKHPLDGELWIARKRFQDANDIAKSQNQPERWQPMKYLVFDAPEVKGPFEDRMKYLADAHPSWKTSFVTLVEHVVCKSNSHLKEELDRITALDGEGLMLRQPSSHYERTRSSTILKVKKFLDTEVEVIDYEAGEGRHKGRVGALIVRLSSGVKCKVGTGLKDKDRDNPPPKGSVITVKFQEYTPDGSLRFPVYVGLRPEGNPNAPLPQRKQVEPVAAVPAAPQTAKVEEKPKKEKAKKEAKTETKTEAKTEAKPKAGPKPVSTPVPVPTPVSIGGATMAATPKRYFEFVDGTSNKFWEIWMDGTDVTTNWGKIGTAGQTKTKSFPDEAKAKKEYDKLLAEKTGKGYVEKKRPA
jgi:DNA ligase 1